MLSQTQAGLRRGIGLTAGRGAAERAMWGVTGTPDPPHLLRACANQELELRDQAAWAPSPPRAPPFLHPSHGITTTSWGRPGGWGGGVKCSLTLGTET